MNRASHEQRSPSKTDEFIEIRKLGCGLRRMVKPTPRHGCICTTRHFDHTGARVTTPVAVRRSKGVDHAPYKVTGGHAPTCACDCPNASCPRSPRSCQTSAVPEPFISPGRGAVKPLDRGAAKGRARSFPIFCGLP